MEMPGDDDGADAVMAQKIAPLHGLLDRSDRSNKSNRWSARGVECRVAAYCRRDAALDGAKLAV
jgi:hypothetical protein